MLFKFTDNFVKILKKNYENFSFLRAFIYLFISIFIYLFIFYIVLVFNLLFNYLLNISEFFSFINFIFLNDFSYFFSFNYRSICIKDFKFMLFDFDLTTNTDGEDIIAGINDGIEIVLQERFYFFD
jgi:hypothetical protein